MLDRPGEQLAALDRRPARRACRTRGRPPRAPAGSRSSRSGIDRQPSSPSWVSSERSRTGLTRWPTSPSTFQVKTRSPTPICGAARPRPGAPSIVSVRSCDEAAQLLVEVHDLDRLGAQDRVAEEADRLDGHPRSLGRRGGARRCGQRDIGSTWIRTGSSLRADRTRWTSPRAPRQRRAVGTRHADHDAGLPVVQLDRAQHLGARGLVEQGEGVVDRTGVADDRGEPAGRRQVGLASGRRPRGARSRRGPSGPAPGGPGGPGRRPRPRWPPARPGPPRRASGAAPPPRCAGRAGPSPARCRAGRRRRSRRRRPARHPGWRPRSAGLAGTVATTWSPPEATTGVEAKARPSSSAVRRSPTTGARSPRWPHSGQAHASSTAPHQRQAGGRAGPATRERSGAHRAAGGRAAALAGQGRGVSAARGLQQDRDRARGRRPRRRRPAWASASPARAGRGRARGRWRPAIETVTAVTQGTPRRGDLVRPSPTTAAARPPRCGRTRRPAPPPAPGGPG